MGADTSAPETFRIAVLDDSATSRLLIQRILLRHFGCEVRAFATPSELLAACSDEPPDLFLIDIALGTADGIAVCRELKSRENTRAVPAILFSERAHPLTRIEALRAGGTDYLDKPFFPEEFLQRVRGCVERFRHQRLLEAQAAEQQALLRVLCHDLGNSMGAAHAMLTLVHQARDEQDRRKCIELSLGASRSALDLIAHVAEYRSLLDQSRPFKIEPVALRPACEESLNIIGPSASAKGVALRLELPVPLTLATNRVVLVHNILNNLLTNAVKFSRPGDTVRVRAAALAGDGDPECELMIEDEGIGIPPAILGALLKQRLVPSRPGTAKEPGTGMGVSLVDLYVRRCGGRLHLESRVADPEHPERRSGTRASVRLPLAAPVVAATVEPGHGALV